MKYTFFFLLLPFSGLIAMAQDGPPPLRVEAGRTAEDGIFGLNQDIIVDGVVTGDLGGVNCDIHVKGVVQGNISVLGGSVLLYRDARVDGNVVSIGGRLNIHENVTLPGKVIHYMDPERVREEDAQSMIGKAAWYFAQVLLAFLLVVIVFYVFPNQVHEASFQLSQDLVRSLIVGVVVSACFFVLLALSFVLMAVGIGFLLFLLGFCALLILAVYGSVIVVYRLSQMMEERLGASLVLAMLLVVALLALIWQVPLLGELIIALVLLFGMGVVMETRFGTNKQWFTRKARYWSAG